jgi:hypothetical protein
MVGITYLNEHIFNAFHAGIFFGLLIPATTYGAITARLILGQEMYSFLIGNNPFQWSYATLVHLVSKCK